MTAMPTRSAWARWLSRWAPHCNVIPFNRWPGSDYERPERVVVARFADLVRRQGASVSLRESKGQDIGAACGQLAGA
jgi:23S rRNA (adenine2503-C2)-methyltransferase